MSCSIKFSSSRSWNGSQRRINSLAEETAAMTFTQTQQHQSHSKQPHNFVVSVGKQHHNHHQQHQHHHQQQHQKGICGKRGGEDTAKLLKYVDDNIVGKNATFFGPFGRRKSKFIRFSFLGLKIHYVI